MRFRCQNHRFCGKTFDAPYRSTGLSCPHCFYPTTARDRPRPEPSAAQLAARIRPNLRPVSGPRNIPAGHITQVFGVGSSLRGFAQRFERERIAGLCGCPIAGDLRCTLLAGHQGDHR